MKKVLARLEDCRVFVVFMTLLVFFIVASKLFGGVEDE